MVIWMEVMACSDKSWRSLNYHSILNELAVNDSRYSDIAEKVPFRVLKIFKVRSPILYAKFLLKKEQYDKAQVLELFHDTAIDRIKSILETNLDWRRVVRAMYGDGVSFARCPYYANSYSSVRWLGTPKAMIIADVLVGNAEVFSGEFPAGNSDTSLGNCDRVVVKYCDDEFYPKYVVHYQK